MSDVELVIKIPREQYALIMQSHRDGVARFVEKEAMMYAIKIGTPLPEGHGKLIDTNEITAFRELECNGRNVESLDEFTTIVEADEEGE